jgi:hypothetical protein
MFCPAKAAPRSIRLFLLVFLLLIITACGDDDETEVSEPTPELVVVEFATDEPAEEAAVRNKPAENPNNETGATPTPGAVAGVGFGSASDQLAGNSQAVPAFVANRPPDVNPLTGLKVDDPALLQRRPLMVRVGNDPGARPQVGLNEADLVYEEIVEWWVTRFTAIYLSQAPDMIAPIRSARLINLSLTAQYQGALANSGGSDPIRWELSQADIVNLDEFFVPVPYFYRPNEGWQTRLAFDASAGRSYLAGEGLDTNIKLRGFFFSDQLELQDATGAANVVVIPYPRQTSQVTWEYDPQSGKYLRSILGASHVDFNGDQVSASNVIIYFADHQETDIVEDSNGATSIRIIINGFGSAWLIRDGRLLKGNWETNGRETPLFTFGSGQPMPFKPGNTWVQVVPPEYIIDIDGQPHGLEAQPNPAEPISGGSDAGGPAATLTPIGARSTATPPSR